MKRMTILLNSKYPAILWTILIFILCTIPSKNIPLPSSLSDKSNHLIAFAGFTFFWLFQSSRPWLILIIAVLYGIGIEFWQAILPESFHRGFEWYDALADSIGGVIGYFIYMVFRKISFLNR
jgi:VanZ family protein